MITIDKTQPEPEGVALKQHNQDGTVTYYLHDDKEILDSVLEVERSSKLSTINDGYINDEKNLTVSKHTYYDLLAAAVSGETYKGKTTEQVALDFKEAVKARQSIQDKHENLVEQINNAKTIEELQLIEW